MRRDYTRVLSAGSLRGARIGVWREGNVGASARHRRDHGAHHRGGCGRSGRPSSTRPTSRSTRRTTRRTRRWQYEFKHDVAAYLRRWTAARYPKTLADLIAFNTAHASTELRYFGQEIFEQSQARATAQRPGVRRGRRDATGIAREAIDSTLAEHDLDAVIAPTNSPAWRTTLGQGDDFVLGSSSPSAISGYPSVTVPAGYSGPLPVGVSFIGGRWSESRLLSLAFAWEQATHVRRKPTYRPSIG